MVGNGLWLNMLIRTFPTFKSPTDSQTLQDRQCTRPSVSCGQLCPPTLLTAFGFDQSPGTTPSACDAWALPAAVLRRGAVGKAVFRDFTRWIAFMYTGVFLSLTQPFTPPQMFERFIMELRTTMFTLKMHSSQINSITTRPGTFGINMFDIFHMSADYETHSNLSRKSRNQSAICKVVLEIQSISDNIEDDGPDGKMNLLSCLASRT